MAFKLTPILKRIIDVANMKREHLDSYPGSRARVVSRAWTEELRELELELYGLWEKRRTELAELRRPRDRG